MSLSYGNYLQLDKVLGAQLPLSPDEHDEMLFIVIHQTYELWFKQVLHEGEHLRKALYDVNLYSALATFKRMLKVLKTMVSQVDILETMSPISFASFRDRLESASGFQSVQFRCLEALLGFKQREKLQALPENSFERKLLSSYIESPSFYDALLYFLAHSGYDVPTDLLNRDVTLPYEGDVRMQELLAGLYKNDLEKVQLCENFIDFDEGVQEWRYRHVKMVERTIGDKGGTGGSLGARYLKATLSKVAFVDLWRVRDRL